MVVLVSGIDCSIDKPQKFHTDMFADIVAMQTRSCAAQGGEHLVASAWNVYNEIATSRPDLIPVLASSDWGFDMFAPLFLRC